MQSAYNWNLNAGFLDDFNDDSEITAEVLRTHNSSFGGIRDAAQLSKAKQLRIRFTCMAKLLHFCVRLAGWIHR